MKTNNQLSLMRRLIAFTLLTCLCAGILFGGNTEAQSDLNPAPVKEPDFDFQKWKPDSEDSGEGRRISPDLLALIQSSEMNLLRAGGDSTVEVIIQFNDMPRGRLKKFLRRNSVSVKGDFLSLNSRAVEIPLSEVENLTSHREVSYVSLDREIRTLGHVERTTGAEDMRRQFGNYGLNGRGIGIAVLDSSVYNSHNSFLGHDGNKRIKENIDFTGKGMNTDDPYGHGTHVAGLAAGGTKGISSAYRGIAPEANILNLRVLDSEGKGTVSGALKALDWVMQNHSKHNIRVVNLSLGGLAVDSYKSDPLCIAVRKLVGAGIVVVAAAGNNGKNSDGQKLYGHIHSPGNEPSAITVGATNSYGTDTRSDDGIASYSSRGPTRSYWTDKSGVRHYDNLIKPDLVAPGNSLVSAQAKNNALVTANPQLDATSTKNYDDDDDDEKNDDKKMMYLSGTSMATPIVAGAAALMLQANPSLTPNMVKAILMYTAQPMAGYNMFEQGAGQINIEGAVRLAKLFRTNLTNNASLGAPLLTASAPPKPESIIARETVHWGQGLILNHNYVTGIQLITLYQKVYGTGMLLGDGILISEGILVGDSRLISDGILIGDSIITSNGMLLGDGYLFLASGMLLGDGTMIADGMLIGDGTMIADGMLIGDGMLLGDALSQAHKALIFGDPGQRMHCE